MKRAPRCLDVISKNCATNKRLPTITRAVDLFLAIDGSTIVETGCYRGIPDDGLSTVVFGMLAQECGGFLDSVDIEQKHADLAASIAKSFGVTTARISVQDSIGHLSEIKFPIDMLYLDSLDYFESNPLPCQIHSLAEASAAVPKMAERSIILIDDASLPGGGKAKLSRKFLQDIGWVVVAEGYQVLLANFDPEKLSKLA